jgi:hypothetical protein
MVAALFSHTTWTIILCVWLVVVEVTAYSLLARTPRARKLKPGHPAYKGEETAAEKQQEAVEYWAD